MLPTRAWELGFGCLIALYATQLKIESRLLREIAGLLGLLLILFSILFIDRNTPFPSYWTLFPVFGASLILIFTDSNVFVGRLLGSRLLVGIGLISYSAYLWHWPLLLFAKFRFDIDSSYVGITIVIILTFFLAYISWRFIETPVRKRNRFSQTSIFVISSLGMIVFFVIAGRIYMNKGVNDQNRQLNHLVSIEDQLSPYREKCHAGKKIIYPEDACVLGKGSSDPIYVWSDSHGVELAWKLSDQLEEFNVPVIQLTHSACIPIENVMRRISNDIDRNCISHNDRVMNYFLSRDKKSTILVVARWPLYLNGERFDNQMGGVESGSDGARMLIGGASDDDKRKYQLSQKIRMEITELINNGNRVVLVYPVPEIGWNVGADIARRKLLSNKPIADDEFNVDYNVFKKRSSFSYETLNSIPESKSLIRVYPEDVFCNLFISGKCVSHINDNAIYYDSNHLNGRGAELLAKEVIDTLINNRFALK